MSFSLSVKLYFPQKKQNYVHFINQISIETLELIDYIDWLGKVVKACQSTSRKN